MRSRVKRWRGLKASESPVLFLRSDSRIQKSTLVHQPVRLGFLSLVIKRSLGRCSCFCTKHHLTLMTSFPNSLLRIPFRKKRQHPFLAKLKTTITFKAWNWPGDRGNRYSPAFVQSLVASMSTSAIATWKTHSKHSNFIFVPFLNEKAQEAASMVPLCSQYGESISKPRVSLQYVSWVLALLQVLSSPAWTIAVTLN